jgi:hypothetical protein
MVGTDNALLAASAPTNFAALAITVTTGKVTVGTNDDKAGYSISGTKQTLDALNDVSTADVNAQVDAALDTAIPGTPTADSINERIKAIDVLTEASGAGDLAAILVDTGEIGAAGAGLTDLGGFSTAAKAAINAEVVDVMRTDTVAELSAVPAANAALHTMIQWLFSMSRNKRLTTSSADTIRNDADAADIGSATISDAAGTFTRAEYT